MYKVNINAAYFENNLKLNNQKTSSNKPKFLLTEQQKQFIQLHLPKGYKLNIASDIDQKRNRTPRKTNNQFQIGYYNKQDKKDFQVLERNSQKKQNRKQKQKQISSSNNSMNQQIQSEIIFPTTPKQSIDRIKKIAKTTVKQNIIKEKQQNQQGQIVQKKRPEKKVEQPKQIIVAKPPYNQITKKASTIEIKKKDMEKNQVQMNKIVQHKQQLPKPKQEEPNNISQNKPNYSLTAEQKLFCCRFLTKLKTFKSSWPFRQPVDPVNQGVPNYLQVIHQPMDLKTIEKKINSNKYEHISEFHGDINKIFLNSYKFNPKSTNYYTLTIQLQDYYHQLLKQVQNNPNILDPDRTNKNLKAKASIKNEQDFIQEESPKKNKNFAFQKLPTQNPLHLNPQVQIQRRQKEKEKVPQYNLKIKKNPSFKQNIKQAQINRKNLFRKVQKLSSKGLQNVISVAFGQIEDERTTFNLDFQKLSEDILIKIQKIVNSQMQKFESSKTNPFAGIQTRMLLF